MASGFTDTGSSGYNNYVARVAHAMARMAAAGAGQAGSKAAAGELGGAACSAQEYNNRETGLVRYGSQQVGTGKAIEADSYTQDYGGQTALVTVGNQQTAGGQISNVASSALATVATQQTVSSQPYSTASSDLATPELILDKFFLLREEYYRRRNTNEAAPATHHPDLLRFEELIRIFDGIVRRNGDVNVLVERLMSRGTDGTGHASPAQTSVPLDQQHHPAQHSDPVRRHSPIQAATSASPVFPAQNPSSTQHLRSPGLPAPTIPAPPQQSLPATQTARAEPISAAPVAIQPYNSGPTPYSHGGPNINITYYGTPPSPYHYGNVNINIINCTENHYHGTPTSPYHHGW
ncbi:MAG: hypothetical protein Q9173_001481 [Seirophora scorigena]